MKKRILTGDRTTGQLHLGHYVGSLQNRVRLQDEYDTFILLADIQALTTHFLNPEIIDGNSKMGKSLGNAIYLADDAETVTAKVKSAVTDTNRIAISDKGNPDICTVNTYHKAFNVAEYNNICDICRNAKIGCVACKKQLAMELNSMLEPIREKRAYYSEHKIEGFSIGEIAQILRWPQGTVKSRMRRGRQELKKTLCGEDQLLCEI